MVSQLFIEHLNLSPTFGVLTRSMPFLSVLYMESGNIMRLRITYSFYDIITSLKILAPTVAEHSTAIDTRNGIFYY